MIETLSFEIDEIIYSTLKAELSVETPSFTGKISPKLPRLINQWVAEDRQSHAPLKRRIGTRRYRGGGFGKAAQVAGPGRILASDLSFGADGGLPGKAALRMPRLVNQWLPEGKNPQVFANDRTTFRRHDRIACRMLIEYTVSSSTYVDFVRNVSRCGAYLETRKGVSVGESVILMIPLSKGRKIIRVRGVVVRKDETGVGIVFKEILAE